jgi:structural maintenance of chromosome 1
MVALEAQMAHSERRLKSATDLAETVRKDEEKQREKLARLQKELESMRKAASVAQGDFLLSVHQSTGH